jgi:hypothetical protein
MGLYYNNGTGTDLSLEHGMWMLAMITMLWLLMNLKGNVDADSCQTCIRSMEQRNQENVLKAVNSIKGFTMSP